MNHPLTGNISELSDADLQKKVSELQKRMMFGYQMGNEQMIHQIEMLLGDYKEEMARRDRERMEKLQQNDGKDWDDLIDV